MLDDNFLEKMMELGIGMSVIRQMPNMFDSCMAQQRGANTPNGQTPPPLNKTNAVTYIAVDGQQAGPLTEKELKTLVKNHILTEDTLVWTPQLVQWTPARLVPSVNKLLLLHPAKTENAPMAAPAKEEASFGTNTANNAIREDAIEAMARLGYKDAGTRKKIDDYLSANPNTTLEDVIKNILQQI